MDTPKNGAEEESLANTNSKDESISPKNKSRNRAKKRKRKSSGSSSEDNDALPENFLEVEKNLQASAIKNNLDDASMKKILKKVVTNDHVLALVKLREEEEARIEEKSLQPKLTRAKAKELMKVSPKTAPWNIELTPIKHIPVKTRPEVKALIAQELPEDEDDEEYKPAQDEVPSDDDHTIESCSDLDSQPRTPATPNSQCTPSPKVVKDGPFKVPQSISSLVKRKLELEEEAATIALRTRSKLSLSTTSIEHIESSFIPPDDIPPIVDDLWSQFLVECLNPGPATKNEEDDETDPEYSVAADPDAHEEDEEALESSIIKISKKELNDLMTELFDIIPESTADKIAESLVSDGILQTTRSEVSWEGKQEPVSDDENQNKKPSRITFEKDNTIRFSIGKTEPMDYNETEIQNQSAVVETPRSEKEIVEAERESIARTMSTSTPKPVKMVVDERNVLLIGNTQPPPLIQKVQEKQNDQPIGITISSSIQILPEQIQILQQQLRQHIQLCASNFLQLYVNPVHWSYGPHYKEYLETFEKMLESNPHSVVNVFNLKPALELVRSWEKSVSENTPENAAMVEYIQKEADRCRRRAISNALYVGNFHETFLKTVANSVVFQYPHLLPAMPYRPDHPKKAFYLTSEDALIALGLDQFWDYVDQNPEIYKPTPKRNPRQRWGYTYTLELIHKLMMPWITTKTLMGHINHVKKTGGPDNPINKWFAKRIIDPVKHVILSISPDLTLYEHPEDELPRIWVRYLAKNSQRFRKHMYKRQHTRTPISGVPINIINKIAVPPKTPLPIEFIKPIPSTRINLHPKIPAQEVTNRLDVNISINQPTPNIYSVVQTSEGSFLLPVQIVQTNTVNTAKAPITTAVVARPVTILPKPQKKYREHCQCCELLRKITKVRQATITEYFKPRTSINKTCPCKQSRPENITKRLKLLITSHKKLSKLLIEKLQYKLDELERVTTILPNEENEQISRNELDFVTSFQHRLMIRLVTTRDTLMKKKLHTCFARFNIENGDPVKLAKDVENIFDVELVDMSKEFLSFLTPKQAVKLDKFKDYFIHNCIKDLIQKVEEQVSNKQIHEKIFQLLQQVIQNKDSFNNECELCVKILNVVSGYPKLAKHVFSLFPHCRLVEIPEPAPSNENCEPRDSVNPIINEDKKLNGELNDTILSQCECSTTVADYEADHSSSGEEENDNEKEKQNQDDNVGTVTIKMEAVSPQHEEATKAINMVVHKEELPDDTDISMEIIVEDEVIKTEEAEWTREEDKLILEVLKENITPQERKDKTILEILEEKNMLHLICENLQHKSFNDVKERVVLILQMLIFSENKP